MDELDLNDVDITNTRRTLTMPVGSRKMLAMESDMDDELDLSKPCEIAFNVSSWVPTVGQITVDEFGGRVFYGCYVRMNGANKGLQHYWREKQRIRNIRNIRQPQYEPHTMQSLLPLANEWVHYCDDKDTVVRIDKLTQNEVTIEGNSWQYRTIAAKWLWATGPDKGKPVAKLLPSSEA